MPIVTTPAIILQAFAYGETSKILRLLTSTHGIQSVIAKGARRPRSRYGGILEPFTEGVATFYVRETRELQTLSAFELGASRQSLGSDLLRFGSASLIAEIVILTTREASHPGLFAEVARAFRRLDSAPHQELEAAALGEAWRLIASLGFAPELDHCLECGRDIPAAAAAAFDYAAGGLRCAECTPGAGGREIPPRARLALRKFVHGEAVTLGRTEGHWWLLGRYLDHHVLEGSRLRSFTFLMETLGNKPCAS